MTETNTETQHEFGAALLKFSANFTTMNDMIAGQKQQLEDKGFSPEIAEQMCVHAYRLTVEFIVSGLRSRETNNKKGRI